MIIIWGSVVAQPGRREQLLALSRAHVTRSRREPGCLSHGAYLDPEDELRVVFYEQWQDRDALRRHFAQPSSREFVTAVEELAAAEPVLQIYQSEPLTMGEL